MIALCWSVVLVAWGYDVACAVGLARRPSGSGLADHEKGPVRRTADDFRVAASGPYGASELTFRPSRVVLGTSRANRKVRQPKIRYTNPIKRNWEDTWP